MSAVQRLIYVEGFAIDLSSKDAMLCDGVNVQGGVLRGARDYEQFDTLNNDYKGLVGANGKYLFSHTDKIFRKFDGTANKNLQLKMPVINPISKDVRSDMYRDIPYVCFDQDGIITYDESNESRPTYRWSFKEAVEDIAIVNERVVTLTNGGIRLRFSESGQPLSSDNESDGVYAPAINLPGPVQAICRYGANTLYAFGNACYKVTFSAKEEDIKVNAIADGLGKVYLHSVKQIADRIVFASKQGLYSLRNDKVKPIFTELNKAVVNYEGCRASVWMGKYVLTVPDEKGRCGYVLDVDQGRCIAVLCRDVVDVCAYKDNDVMVMSDGRLVRFADDAYRTGVFARSRIDFGDSRRKYLRKLNITTKYDVSVSLTDENGVKRSYVVNGSDKMQSVRICGNGRTFGMEIRSFGQMEVRSLSIVAEAYKEVCYVN